MAWLGEACRPIALSPCSRPSPARILVYFSRPSHLRQIAYPAWIGFSRGATHMDTNLREVLLEVLKAWAAQVIGRIGSDGVLVFGSLVYRGREQFNAASSDVDLVLLFPSAG